MSESELLKFDLFIDDEYLIDNCDVTVYLSGDRRYTEKNFTHTLNSSKLKFGWNKVEIPLKSFKAESGADLSQINCFAVQIIINKPFETLGNFAEYFMMGLDNIRVCKSYSVVEMTDDDDNDENIQLGDGYEQEDIRENVIQKIQYIENSPEEKILRLKKQIIKKKAVEIDDIYGIHGMILIVTAAVTGLIFALNTILILVRRKRIK